MCNNSKFRKSLYDVFPLCKKEANTRKHEVNECRELKEVREKLRRNLKQNMNANSEITNWELIKYCYFWPDEGELRKGKKQSIKYIKHFCKKLYEKHVMLGIIN